MRRNLHPDGIDGYRDEQERCDAAEEAAEDFKAERDEAVKALVAAGTTILSALHALYLDELGERETAAAVNRVCDAWDEFVQAEEATDAE